MDKKFLLSYLNDSLALYEETLWHELGGIAGAKGDMVGVSFIRSQNIIGNTTEDIIGNCIKAIVKNGIAEEIKYVLGGKGICLKLRVKGCCHLPAATKVKNDGIKPYMCPIVNMIVDRLIEQLGYETAYVADLEVDEGSKQCQLICAIYENIDKIGQVSDWTKIPNP